MTHIYRHSVEFMTGIRSSYSHPNRICATPKRQRFDQNGCWAGRIGPCSSPSGRWSFCRHWCGRLPMELIPVLPTQKPENKEKVHSSTHSPQSCITASCAAGPGMCDGDNSRRRLARAYSYDLTSGLIASSQRHHHVQRVLDEGVPHPVKDLGYHITAAIACTVTPRLSQI